MTSGLGELGDFRDLAGIPRSPVVGEIYFDELTSRVVLADGTPVDGPVPCGPIPIFRRTIAEPPKAKMPWFQIVGLLIGPLLCIAMAGYALVEMLR